MRRAIEKLSFLLLSLAAASLVSFVLLSRLVDARGRAPARLPLLFNPDPRNVQGLTRAALNEVAAGGPGATAGRAELVRLGGAAFPHVLPALDSLEPTARGRVALALAPVALRMGVAEDDDLETPERAVAFFARFWQDRSADFRGAVVRRKVARLAERALSLRRKEVVELDTFALEELLGALGRVQYDEDVKRAARLTPVLAHVTGMPWRVEPETSRADAAATVTRWRDWAIEHAADFQTLDGPGRLEAMVMQTRYFRWLSSLPRALSGEDELGSRKLHAALAGARQTLPLGALALGLGLTAAAALARARDRRARRWRGLSLLMIALASLPLAVLALRAAAAGLFALGLALTLSVGATASVELGLAAPARGRFRQAFDRAAVLLPPVLAGAIAGETVLGRGLGALTRRALGEGDLTSLMWVAFALSGAGAVTAATLGLAFPSRAPRDHELREFGHAPRRTRVILLACALLAAMPVALLATSLGAPSGESVGLLTRTLGVALAGLGGATALGLTLGLLAGGLSRSADALLARCVELAAVLPQPFLAATCFLLGSLPGALALGALRGVEIAHVIRNRLREQRGSGDREPASFGRAPIAPYVRRFLPAALAPFATTLVLSVPWIFALDAACASIGATSGGTLASVAVSSLPSLAGVALLGLGLAVLARELTPHEYVGETPGARVVLALKRRTGRSSFPPPGDSYPPGSFPPPSSPDHSASDWDLPSAPEQERDSALPDSGPGERNRNDQ
jgi:ABC-type dipeptide/oligopeptide/nickel transport system permease subunit